ncbi:MAG: DUF3108 domain-containing protein [Elusimicrobiota bacterium]|jgi:hypothetical protein|nr:DUF3108 domain-containing protein [Elusimicrobiota bacterium]
MRIYFALLPPLAIALTLGACGAAVWHKPLPVQPAAAQTVAHEEPQCECQDELPQQTRAPHKSVPVPARQPAKPAGQKTEPKPQPAQTEPAEPAEPVQTSTAPRLGADGRLMHPWHGAPQIADYAGPKPAWLGESLKFKVGWSFITAGEAELITNKIVQTPAGPAFTAEAYAQSHAVIDALFKVRDINISWIAADLKKSLGYWQSVREGGYMRDEWLIFDYKNNSYEVHKQNNKKEISQTPYKLTGAYIWDMLSSLYFVRSQKLPLKGEIFFDIVNVNKQYPLKVIVHGKETVKVKAGKFDCILVEPMISGEGIFVSKGKSLKVWLTDDEYKMPVKMSVEVFIGSVYAELVSFERKTSS